MRPKNGTDDLVASMPTHRSSKGGPPNVASRRSSLRDGVQHLNVTRRRIFFPTIADQPAWRCRLRIALESQSSKEGGFPGFAWQLSCGPTWTQTTDSSLSGMRHPLGHPIGPGHPRGMRLFVGQLWGRSATLAVRDDHWKVRGRCGDRLALKTPHLGLRGPSSYAHCVPTPGQEVGPPGSAHLQQGSAQCHSDRGYRSARSERLS
jgi:hypothetical protein